jgi:hypothetical protein
MSTLSPSNSAHRSVSQVRRSRPLTKYPLQCEALETRQLLSVGQGSLAPNVLPFAATPAAAIFAPPVSAGNAATNFATFTITFQSFYGITFIPISFGGAGGFSGGFNPGQVYGPSAPTGSIGGSLGSDPVNSPIGTTVGSTSVNPTSGSPFTSATPAPITNSITALNPTANANVSNPILPPVFALPPTVAPVVVHFTASVSPVTNIANSTALSMVQEQPTELTHFGQGPDVIEPRSLLSKGVVDDGSAASVLDFVEPLQNGVPAEGAKPAAPADGKNGEPGKPGAAPEQPNRPIVPPPGLSDRELAALTSFIDDTSLAAKRDSADLEPGRRAGEAYYSWSLSTVFGATIVAAGGYHLALREADRFKGRWVPRWVGAERPTKRKSTT